MVLKLKFAQIFEVSEQVEIMRVMKIAKEFGLDFLIKGGGDEYQQINA